MKKIKYLIIILTIFLVNNHNIYAKTTKNGVNINNNSENTTSLVCTYTDGRYIRIDETDHLEISPDISNFPFKEISYDELRKYGFIDENDNWDCPSHAIMQSFGSDKIINFINNPPSSGMIWIDLEVENSECNGKCSIVKRYKSGYNCEYVGYGGTLKIQGDETGCTINHPTGRTEDFPKNGPCSLFTYNSCPDLFYNQRTREIQTITFDYNNWSENAGYNSENLFNFICGKDKDNVHYYCIGGNCEFPNNQNINCSKLDKKINGKTNTKLIKICKEPGVLKSFRFFGYLLLIVKILIPIILIIMGSIDFAKAIVASNQDAVQKSAKSFAIRIATGVLIFLLPTIINFVFDLLPSSVNDYKACEKCLFKPNKCEISK